MLACAAPCWAWAWASRSVVRRGLVHPQPADHRRHRQPVQQQRGDGDEEGEEDQGVALRHGVRDDERRGERDHAAHPGPRDHRGHLPGRGRVGLADPAEEHPGQVGRREHPDRAGQHRHRRDHHAVEQEVRDVARRADHRRELQADQGEDHRLQDRVARPPQHAVLQPGGVAALRRAVAEVEPGDDHREQPGGVHALGEQVHAERARPAPARSRPAGRRAAAGCGAPPSRRPARRRCPRRRRGRTCRPRPSTVTPVPAATARNTRNSVSAVASLIRLSPPRIVITRRGRFEPAADGQRGDGVRRRDHRAQHQARGQSVRPGINHEATTPTTTAVNATRPDGEQPDRPLVGPDPEVGRVERGRVQQRGQHEQQHDLRVERHLDDARDQRRRQAGDDEHESGADTPEPAADRGDGE